MAQRIVTGDMVEVVTGKHKGKKGKVESVITATQRVRIEGIAMVKRHLAPNKSSKNQEGGIIDKLGSIHLSNVMPTDPESGKPTRIGFKTLADGRKVRVARRSGAEFP